MDSLSQIVLGASVAELAMGNKIGRKATFWGAALGTLPDLDVLIRYADPLDQLTQHRGFSHSLIVLTLVSPIFAWGLQKLHGQASYMRYFLMVWLALITHPLLDWFTTFGTQLLWPLDKTPYSLNSMFIIDPLYTLPLVAGLIALGRMEPQRGLKWVRYVFIFSCLYLGWSLVAKQVVEHKVQASLEQQNIKYEKLFSAPFVFNTVLWRVVLIQNGGYSEGYTSLLDKSPQVKFTFHPTQNAQTAQGLAGQTAFEKIKAFSHGFYAIETQENNVFATDLRLGAVGGYLFRFKIAQFENGKIIPAPPQRASTPRNLAKVPLALRRIWDESIDLNR